MIPKSFFVDHLALKAMFEGKGKGKEILKEINDLKYKGVDISVSTTMSCFLRALFLADPKLKIGTIQKTLNFLKVGPSFADFKSEKQVTDEIMKVVRINGRRKNG